MDTNPVEVRRILQEASELSPSERTLFLDKECAGDPELRALVERLLGSLFDAGEFLAPAPESPESPGGARLRDAIAADPDLLASSFRMERPGARIGPYRLLEEIGVGGFGVVFLAEQQTPVVRRVALKVIKLGMDTRQVIARFEAERQALALMDHPNIAKVLDAGATETGRPYFVMEYVRGEPITEYCDRNSLSTRERLKLFVDICGAIQHAHQKGVIHRDIKPANILVTTADGRAIPKVIDFGIAKATGARLTEKTLFTAHHQLIGTPQYMSPEQADTTAVDIDTRSDIYSLGVLLYELLTGTTPFDIHDLRQAALSEMQRIIRDVEPPKPSTRLSTLGDALSLVASRRDCDPSKLARLVRGDLDWIVMKSLDKERTRRYETANGLARDIARHLADEPVTAGPPSRWYTTRKFVRRNRAMVIGASIVAAVLVLGILGTSAGMIWALDERERAADALKAESEQRRVAQESQARAQAEATRAKTALSVLDDMLKPPPATAQGGPVEDSESGARLFAGHVGDLAQAWGITPVDDPEVEAGVRLLLGRTLRNEGLHDAAVRQFERVVEIRRALGSELAPELGQALRAQTEALSAGGNAPAAMRLASAALDRARAVGPNDPMIAERLCLHADACTAAGELVKAEASSREALALREKSSVRIPVAIAENLAQLAGIVVRGSRKEEAVAIYQDAAEYFRAARGELDAGTWAQEKGLVSLYNVLGQRATSTDLARDAVERARRAMSAGPPAAERRALIERLRVLSDCLEYLPDSASECADVGAELLKNARTLPERDPLELGIDLAYAARGLWWQGRERRGDAAEKLLRESTALAQPIDTTAGRRRIDFNRSALALSILYGPRGRTQAGLAEAEAEFRDAYMAACQYNPRGSWTVWLCALELAWVVRLRGDASAADALEKSVAAMDHAGILATLPTAWRLQELGEGLMEFERLATADVVLTAREQILRKRCPDHWLRWDAVSSLAGCRGRTGKFGEAEPLLRESIARLIADPATPSAELRRALARTADFYAAWNTAAPAIEREMQAAEWRGRLAEHDAARGVPEHERR